jgi:ATP-binding cassette subfamily F protein 3
MARSVHIDMVAQIVGDDTKAIESVLKADVWRDHLLKEQASLDANLAELESEDDDRRVQEAKEELSSRLAEVHARLADMEAESGPSRAAALLAGMLKMIANLKRLTTLPGLGFDEADQQRPTKSFSGGWRYL